jgi:MFS family permease
MSCQRDVPMSCELNGSASAHGGRPFPNIKPNVPVSADAVGGNPLAMVAGAPVSLAWWKEPAKDQWFAWFAAWLGWMLDAFDFTIFLFIMAPIAREFGVSVTAVAAVLAVTIWMRFIGAVASGWLADRIGRKTPLMLSILWYSVCNFVAGFSPSLTFLFIARAALGIGMGAEWPVGASLAMESWPARSRGLMGSLLQGAFPLGFALASAAYGSLFDAIGWRGLLWLGILPAFLCVYIRYFVKESEVWVENRKNGRSVYRFSRSSSLRFSATRSAHVGGWLALLLLTMRFSGCSPLGYRRNSSFPLRPLQPRSCWRTSLVSFRSGAGSPIAMVVAGP